MEKEGENKFLENVIEASKELDAPFLIANAVINHHPIIFCSHLFAAETGFSRNEVTRKDIFLDFLYGKQTSKSAKRDYERAIRYKKQVQIEMILYSKNEEKRWWLVTTHLIKESSSGEICLYLVLFSDITHAKPKILDSPKRKWKKAAHKLLGKADMNVFRSNLLSKDKKPKKKKTLDMESIQSKMKDAFIPQYGGERIQVPKFVILQTLQWKSIWDALILGCILYTSCVVPFTLCFPYTGFILTIFDTIVDTMFLMDIILTFFTTYVDEKTGELIRSLKMIRWKYLKTWFAFDFISSLPYGIVNFFDQTSSFVGIFRLLKMVRLIRIGKTGKKMKRYMQNKTVTLAVWLVAFCLCAHWMACIWFAIALKIDKPYHTPHSWLTILAQVYEQPFHFDENHEIINGTGPSLAAMYISALYYTMSSVTTCGFGNIAPNTSAEKVFGCVTMLLGCVLYALIFGQVTNIISQLQKNSNEFSEQLNSIKQFNTTYKVPELVAKRVENYYKATWAVTKGTDEEEILKTCPRDLQSDLCLHIHSQILTDRAFKGVSLTALRVLSRYFDTIRTSPGDKLIYQGESVESLYFVATGSLEVKQGDDLIGLIGPSDVFGMRLADEGSGRSLYDVEACSFGTIHSICTGLVHEALALYPEDLDKIKYQLILSFDITRQVKIMTKSGELFTTEMPESMKEKEPVSETNVYTNGDDITALDYSQTSDVLAGMSELKGELRRETERMNSKMGVVEAQMILVLKLLRRNNTIDVDPEIGMRLNQLESVENIDEAGEWFVADSQGWKEIPPENARKESVFKPPDFTIVTVAEKMENLSENPHDPTTLQKEKKNASKDAVKEKVRENDSKSKKKPRSAKHPIKQPKSTPDTDDTETLIETIRL